MNKTLYGIIGVVILAAALFFIGRLTVTPEPQTLDPKYIKMERTLDSLKVMHKLSQDSLMNTLYLIAKSAYTHDSELTVYKNKYKQKARNYEKLWANYTNMSDDSLQLVITNRLDASIRARVVDYNDQ